jgi:hypothetical protein
VTNADAAIAAAGRERGRIQLRIADGSRACGAIEAVESWFLPGGGDEPYVYTHVLDAPATPTIRRDFGIAHEGTRVTVPLADGRLPPNARLRRLVTDLVQLRPIFEDESREVLLELPGEPLQLVRHTAPEPDPERPVLFDDKVELQRDVVARVVVRRAAQPIPLTPARAARRGGLIVVSGRAAHEATLAGLEARPGARHLYGEVRCEAIEQLQRQALDAPRPQVVVRVDRSGLNDAHPLVRRLYAALERILRPIIEAEERRAGARLVRAGKEIAGLLDEVGLRALNDALRAAFDAPGQAGFARGATPTAQPPIEQPLAPEAVPPLAAPPSALALNAAMRFRQSPVKLHPGEERGISLLFDPARVSPGTPIEIATDPGLSLRLYRPDVPEPVAGGWSRVSGKLRAFVSAEPGSQLSAIAEAGGYDAELIVLVVRHHGSGWVREIARKDEDAHVEAEFEPETGIVTVYEGVASSRRSSAPRSRPPSRVRVSASTCLPNARGRGGGERRLLVGR